MSDKKKILILGSSDAQLIAIKRAKELGYYTVVCDYLPDNPGQYVADSFHLVSTTDKEAILNVAKAEKINGIVAYSSDPAAPTAAFVANQLRLPGLNYEKVCHFCKKQLFRQYLNEHGFNTPKSLKVNLPYDITTIDLDALTFPIIVKPTDSSGSKGVTVLENIEGLESALKYAEQYSRNKTIIIEEFIQRDHPHVIEAEIFAINGEVKSWGLINSIRDWNTNPLLPAGYSYPLDLPEERIAIVQNEVQRLVKSLGTPSGAFNIEMIIDQSNHLYFLDAGPRNGGNMLPEFISMISGKDIVGATIKNAVGYTGNLDVALDGKSGGNWGLVVLHADRDGIFDSVKYSQEADQSLVRQNIQVNSGDHVNAFSTCNNLIGLSFLKFNSPEQMKKVMYNLCDSIQIRLKSADPESH